MWNVARSSVIVAVLSSMLAINGCTGQTSGTPRTSSELPAAMPLTTYTFKVENATKVEVTLRTFDKECMGKTLDGKIAPGKTQNYDVETVTGQGCESNKESAFTTSFSRQGPGDYSDYRFVKRTLSPWRLEHRHDGPRSTLHVSLDNKSEPFRVKIYTTH